MADAQVNHQQVVSFHAEVLYHLRLARLGGVGSRGFSCSRTCPSMWRWAAATATPPAYPSRARRPAAEARWGGGAADESEEWRMWLSRVAKVEVREKRRGSTPAHVHAIALLPLGPSWAFGVCVSPQWRPHVWARAPAAFSLSLSLAHSLSSVLGSVHGYLLI